MNQSKVRLFFIILLVLTIVFVILGIFSLIMKWTVFELSVAYNKIFDLILGLVSLLAAFSLGQVYWDGQLKRDRSELLHQTTLMYIGKIQSLAFQARELLEPIDPNFVSMIEDHNVLFIALLDEIERICLAYTSVFGQLPVLEDKLLVEFYFEKLQPVISQLSICRRTQENQKKIQILSSLITVCRQFQLTPPDK